MVRESKMRRITPNQPKINIYEDGFSGHDKFDRTQESKALSDLVENIDEPLVISLDGKWGSGKSHFLQCWAGAHSLENGGQAITIYYDAFKDDYLDNPLAGLMYHLTKKASKNPKNNDNLRLVKAAMSKLWKPGLRIALAFGSAGLSEIAAPAVDAAISATEKELSDKIETFLKNEDGKRGAIEEFRESLIQLTQPDENGEPTQKFVFIVDELDRCRPDFALSVLEVIKHFFDVNGVHFVLGVHIEALKNTVQTRYGQSLDAELYLTKFISVKLTLKDVTIGGKYKPAKIRQYFSSEAEKMGIPQHHIDAVQWWTNDFEELSFRSIRHAQRVLTEVSLLPKSLRDDGRRLTMMALVLIKHENSELYKKCVSGKLEISDILEFFNLPSKIDGNTDFKIRTADTIWRSILSPETVYEPERRRNLWGMWGLDNPDEVIPELINEIELIQLTSKP